MFDKSAAFSVAHGQLWETLRTLLSPGNRSRLSPYVEAAQLNTLFGEWPDATCRSQSIVEIVGANESKVCEWVKLFQQFAHGRKQFREEAYEGNFLDLYACKYFPTNVAKIQLVMLELAEVGLLQGDMRLLDIGVGTGTTAVAVLDFMLAWSTVCALYGVAFPVTDVSIVGVDRSPEALSYAARMTAAYRSALAQRPTADRRPADEQPEQRRDADARGLSLTERIHDWAAQTAWQRHDLAEAPVPLAASATLVVASNVQNELDEDAKRHLDETLEAVGDGALLLMLEPGDKNKSQNLMRWRRRFLVAHPAFRTLGPCGTDVFPDHQERCGACWCARRENLHHTELYGLFEREAARTIPNDRLTQHDNQTLSWSYVILRHLGDAAEALLSSSAGGAPGRLRQVMVGDTIDSPLRLRYLGSFYQSMKEWQVAAQGVYAGASGEAELIDSPKRLIKVCAANTDSGRLVVHHRPGLSVPPLRFGDEFLLQQPTRIATKRSPSSASIVVWTQLEGKDVTPVEGRGTDRGDAAAGHGATEPAKPSGFLPEYGPTTRAAVDEMAYRLFGFDKGMRDFQHDILERVLCGKPILGIAATGGGKSECFMLPAMLLPGVTVVVSPLLSLMSDQIDRVRDRYGLGQLTTKIDGRISRAERELRLQLIEKGFFKLAYFTPEQLAQSWVVDFLKRCGPRLRYIAFDEAHCISQWGHNFRPAYLNLIERMRERGLHPVPIALTATASKRVREDICEELDLDPRYTHRGGDVLVDSSNRPEINLIVKTCNNAEDKSDEIVRYLERHLERGGEDGAMVFMPHTGGAPQDYLSDRHKATKYGKVSPGVSKFAAFLEHELDRRVQIFHGDLEDAPPRSDDTENYVIRDRPLGDLTGRYKEKEQRRFVKDNKPIMVATKGFGMGIDKSNIRLVLHRTPPANLESYAQEFGRAGRDGAISDAVLFYSPTAKYVKKYRKYAEGRPMEEPRSADLHIQDFFITGRYIRVTDILVMRNFLRQHPRAIHPGGREYKYFTSDEAIAYFDDAHVAAEEHGYIGPFEWPELPEREPRYRETAAESQALAQGARYQAKAKYIERVIEALYRIRPRLEEQHRRVAFLTFFARSGARLAPYGNSAQMRVRAADILTANRYFADWLRHADLTPDTLDALLRRTAGEQDITPLALRIGRSYSECATMLRDIIHAEEHRLGHDRLLLNGRVHVPDYGFLPRQPSPVDRIRQRGASRKKSPPKPSGETLTHPAKPPGTYDLLDPVWPKGWEVEIGLPVRDDEVFEPYLSAFEELHTHREQQDRDNYHLLLSDYVGVKTDGSIDPHGTPGCLRNVLLGYLLSGEVVDGGNCRSCSRCVPDERELDSYDISARKEVLRKWDPETAEHLNALDAFEDEVPSLEALAWLSEPREPGEQRALFDYLRGQTIQELNANPDHLGALTTRLHLQLLWADQRDPALIASLIERLRHRSARVQRTAWPIVAQTADAVPAELEVQYAAAQLALDIGESADAAERLSQAIEMAEGQPDQKHRLPMVQISLTLLVGMYSPSGALADLDTHHGWLLRSCLASAERDRARRDIQPVACNYGAPEIEGYLQNLLSRFHTPHGVCGTLIGWAAGQQVPASAWVQVVGWIESHLRSFGILRGDDLADLLLGAGPAPFEGCEEQLIELLGELAGAEASDVTRDAIGHGALHLYATGHRPGPAAPPIVARWMLEHSKHTFGDGLPEPLRRSPERTRTLLRDLVPHLAFTRSVQLQRWLRCFPLETHLETGADVAVALLERAVPIAADEDVDEVLLELLEQLLETLLDTEHAGRAHDAWVRICRTHPRRATEHLRRCRDRPETPDSWIADAHDAWTVNREVLPPPHIYEHLDEIATQDAWVAELHQWWTGQNFTLLAHRSYLRRLLSLSPPRYQYAEELFFALLDITVNRRKLSTRQGLRQTLDSVSRAFSPDDPDAQRAAANAMPKLAATRALIEALDELCGDARASWPLEDFLDGGAAFGELRRRLRATRLGSEVQADLHAAVMAYLAARTTRSWLTPLRHRLRSLAAGRRFQEARALAEEYPDIDANGVQLRPTAKQAESTDPAHRPRTKQDAYDAEYQAALEAYDGGTRTRVPGARRPAPGKRSRTVTGPRKK